MDTNFIQINTNRNKIKKCSMVTLIIFVVLTGRGRVIFSQAETKDIKYFGVNYRDPFLSFLPEERVEEKVEIITPPDLKLQGIVWGSPKPQAIINNTVLGKDDVIQGAKILEIKKEGIDFIYKEHYFWIDRISGTIRAKEERE